MRNFIIIFSGHEGTTPLVDLLNNFSQIAIISHGKKNGLEPFDRHNCGSMSLKNLERCLDIIFDDGRIDFNLLNQIYCKTSILPIEEVCTDGVVGLKMRYNNYRNNPLYIESFHFWNRLLRGLLKIINSQKYHSMLIELLQRHNIGVFFVFRQDLLRWAVSMYGGHLQFDLARGKITKDDIGKIQVDCKKLGKIISNCKKENVKKHRLLEELKLVKIPTHVLYYENFITNKYNYFRDIFKFLELKYSKEKFDSAVARGEYFKKVHSDDLSERIINYSEVLEQFGEYLTY